MNPFPALIAVALSLPMLANAQTERDLGSHEHGSATLNVVIDASAVYLELGTPWNNLVGFEHVPSTEEQRVQVDEALELLNQPDRMFSFEGGDCSAGAVDIDSGMQAVHGDGHHDKDAGAIHDEYSSEDHGSADHDGHASDEHAGTEHDEHASEEHGNDQHDAETHTTALITYSYDCEDSASLSAIEVEIFGLWDGFDDLDVQLIGPGGQAAVELGPDQTRLDVSQVR